jgi:hypothetical protein
VTATASRIGFGPRGPSGNHQDPVKTIHLGGGNPEVRQRAQKHRRATMTRDLGVWAAPDCALVLTVAMDLAEVTGIDLVVDGGMKVW